MRRISPDVVIALGLTILCGALFWETFSYQKVHMSIIGAKLWPRIVVITLGVLSLAYLVQSLRAAPAPSEGAFSVRRWLADNRNVIGCFGFYALFLAALPWLGMLIAGSLFVFAVLTLIGERTVRAHAMHAAIAIGTIGAMWAMFRFGLGVILPEGELLPR